MAPGFVDTEILDAMTPETLEAALKIVPLAPQREARRDRLCGRLPRLGPGRFHHRSGLGRGWRDGDDVIQLCHCEGVFARSNLPINTEIAFVELPPSSQ